MWLAGFICLVWDGILDAYSFHQVALILFSREQGHVCDGPGLSVSDESQSRPAEHCGCQLVGDCLGLLGGVEVHSNL